MLAAIGTQGVIGYVQYFNHLPAGLVWVHVTGSVLVWIAVLRLYLTLREAGAGKCCANRVHGDRTQQAAGAAGPIGSCRERTGQS